MEDADMTTDLSGSALVFDSRQKRKCVFIETLISSPSEWPNGFPVDLVPEDDPTGEPISARATISKDRKVITFKLDGTEVFQAEVAVLWREMHGSHPKRFVLGCAIN